MGKGSVVGVVLVAVLGSAVPAADWPQWRGPQRDGRSPETGLLERWPEGGPPLAWKRRGVGSGFSSVAVVGERVYTLGDLHDGQYAIALEGGRLRWQTKIGPKHEDQYGGPRSTPTVAGDRIYVLGTRGDLYALAAEDGAVRWQRSLPRDFGGRMMRAQGTYHWEFSESPLVDGKHVIVTPGAADAALVALDADTGNTVWRATIPDLGERGAAGAGYASIVVSQAAGRRQYVQLLGSGLVGIDAETGKFLWGYNRVANDVANIPTPLVQGDHVFASSGYGTGAALLRIASASDSLQATEVYFLSGDTMQNHHGGMILDRGVVYAGSGHNKGFPVAVRFETGEIAWGPLRNEGKGSAAVSFADGRLYFRYQDGLMVLVEATPEGYREAGSFMIPDVQRESWSHPAIANGKLFLREQDTLYVYDLRPPAQPVEGAEAAAPSGS
jgi:outer membrane protein assembly factor BamB